MSPPEASHVFFSYAGKDAAALAQRPQKDLTDQGFDVWQKSHKFTPSIRRE